MESAIKALLVQFSWNPWFTESFWPENEQRIRLILSDIQNNVAVGEPILDVGCANGFLTFLLSKLGYRVTATDAAEMEERVELFSDCGADFFCCNLNEPSALNHLPANSFAAVVMGEIFEHILNHPLGLMRSIARITSQEGALIMTTPNPATIANAYRTLMGRNSLWGTPEFMNLPKVQYGRITDIGHVHFREYLTPEISRLLSESGFMVERVEYFAHGSSRQQPLIKRLIKSNPLIRSLLSHRALGANQYVLARRKDM